MADGEGEVIDFVRRRKLRDELRALSERNTGMRATVTSVNMGGQLSLSPVPGFARQGQIVIDGMEFTCTTWGGGGASA